MIDLTKPLEIVFADDDIKDFRHIGSDQYGNPIGVQLPLEHGDQILSFDIETGLTSSRHNSRRVRNKLHRVWVNFYNNKDASYHSTEQAARGLAALSALAVAVPVDLPL